jgi:glycine/D-amino acid oxidase-like deaminating enzyme
MVAAAMSGASVQPPSFWLAELGDSLAPRASLEGEQIADVAIVGAGYTGLWTAYYLAAGDASLRIAVVESEVAGFGASGRNGGWCTLHHAGVESWVRGPKREGAIALQRAMFDAVDEVGRVAAAEGIDCDYAKAGFLTVVTNEAEIDRARALLAEAHRRGFGEADFRWLDARECDARVRIAGARGGLYSPHGAALQPAKLARGLARAIERRGVAIYEQSAARSVAPGEVVTERGRLRARTVLLCTEGYSQHLDPQRRLLPLHSMMIATAPLSDAQWREIGAADRVVFGDARRILTYAQRTADGRIALGAGGLYLYGSRARRHFPPEGPDFRAAERSLAAFFPQLRGVEITHRWGGAFGVPRDSKPFVRFDARTGAGAAGGYFGNGVATANLAGRTLADLVSGRDTERTTHPWVQHRSPGWEPEPLRWLAVNAVLRLGAAADRREGRGHPAGLRGAIFDAMSGH